MPFETWSDRRSERAQGSLFLCADALPASEGHPFYTRLNELLTLIDFVNGGLKVQRPAGGRRSV